MPRSRSRSSDAVRFAALACAFGLFGSLLAATASAQIAFSNFLTPDGATAPFEDWSRGDAGSSFAAWESFTDPLGPNTHLVTTLTTPGGDPVSPVLPPDGVATVTEAGAVDTNDDGVNDNGAFITSSGNLYSFSAPTAFDVVMASQGLGDGFNTQFVAQVGTIGSLTDPSSFLLSYENGAGQTVSVAPQSNDEIRSVTLGGAFGGLLQERRVVWEISGFNPDELLLTFAAEASSVGLDYLTLDVFASPGPTPGDYDGNGSVGPEDYPAWAAAYAGPGPAADGNGDGVVDAADFTLWRDNLAASATAVPEPTGVWLIAPAAFTLLRARRRRGVTIGGIAG